jgi:histidinol-phosphate aminotransferase
MVGKLPLANSMSSDASLLNTFRPDVLAMHAYVVQDAAGYIKLDAMENPFSLPPSLQAELGARLGKVALNRYPGVRVNDLHAALRAYAHVPADYGLVLGNGSDELISLLSVACAQPGAVAMAPLPGFVMYEAFAKQTGMKFVGVPLMADFELDAPAMLAAIREHKPALTYIAYPNNPTANLWDDAVIDQIVDAVGANGQGLVVIDEAYQPFASKSYLDRLPKHPHVLLMRTLSKFGLAGVIKSERERLLAALATMPGAKAYPSQANMILVRVNDSASVFNALKARGILIKNVAGMHRLLANCIRLTVGLPSENDAQIAALTELLREPLISNPA